MGGASDVKIANFTFVFGSNPATGAQSDPDFVKMFIKHLNEAFDPEDDSLMLPECLGNIDTLSSGKVNFESTSANVGRSLKLRKQTNRVIAKQLIVIVQNPDEIPQPKDRNADLPPLSQTELFKMKHKDDKDDKERKRIIIEPETGLEMMDAKSLVKPRT